MSDFAALDAGAAAGLPAEPWISLLVLQASPFCNVDCDYCYLPSRTSTRRMPMEVLEQAVSRTFASGLVRDELSIIWHAGEPLAVPISWYRDAFAVVERVRPAGLAVNHSFQSNGTLLSRDWCEFIREHRICIGLSIDGPEPLHDAHRKTRQGGGTHARALRGLRLLREHGIPFHVIAVVTAEALDQAGAIYDFFESEGVDQLGFNIEEIECDHRNSTLEASHQSRVRAFFETIFDRQKSRCTVMVREFEAALDKIRSGSLRAPGFPLHNEQVRPFGIVSVDCEGNFSTWSPELLGMNVAPYGSFSFGNVRTDDFVDALATEKFRSALADIGAGIVRCAETCAFYGYCGGGAPANKYYENGSFASTETMYCRYSIQMPMDIVLRDLEAALGRS